MFKDKQVILLGNKNPIIRPKKIFDKEIIEFLDQISKTILKNKEKISFPEIISFGFWCRKKNILNFKKIYGDKVNYLYGRGFGFHVAPSNVPTAFAFSFAFGILSGNSNIIRISSNKNEISDKLIKIFKTILKKKKIQTTCIKK